MSENQGNLVSLVPDKVCEEAGLTFEWCGTQALALYALKERNNEDGQSSFAPCEDNVYLVEENSILNDPEMRKLINESNTTFISSRNIQGGVDLKKRILDLSREHRSSLRQCIENMHFSMQENETDVYNDWVDIFKNIELVWHLLELLYLEALPGEIVLPKLLDWLRLNSSDFDMWSTDVLCDSNTTGAELRCPNYWELVMGLLMEGRFKATRALLRLHSHVNTNAFTEANMLLKNFPVYTSCCGLSPIEFKHRWRGWKSLVKTKVQSGVFQSSPKLLEIMKIFSTDEPIYSLLKPYCNSWYQMLGAVLLFTDQTVKIDDLSYHANHCISHFCSRPELKLLDHTLLALFDGDLVKVLRKLKLTADGGWCVVHLMNLLDISGILSVISDETIDIDAIFLEYGQFLISHRSFWQVGITYLEHSRKHGKEVMELALLKLPLSSKEKALHIINTAKSYGLDNVVSTVCKTMLNKALARENLAGALTWALMSNDADCASMIADKYLRKFALGYTEVELDCCAAMSHLGQSTMISSRLMFLAKYCELCEMFKKVQKKEASQLLIRLLDSKIAPKYFWLTLLLDCLPFMSDEKKINYFSHDDAIIMAACLDEVCIDVENNIPRGEKFEKNVTAFRKLLSKILSDTSMLEEGSAFPANYTLKCY